MLSLFFITGFLREFQTCSLDIQTCSLHFTFDSEIVLYFIPRKQWRDAYKELCIRMLKLEPCYKNKNWKNLTHQKKKISEHISYYKYLCMYYSQKYALLALDNISVLHSTQAKTHCHDSDSKSIFQILVFRIFNFLANFLPNLIRLLMFCYFIMN